MTDPRTVALAKALHKVGTAHPNGRGIDRWPDAGCGWCLNDAAAILAALPPDWCGHAEAVRYQRALEVEQVLAAEDREKYKAEIARLVPIEKAARDMLLMAVDGAARQHLDRSGIMQDPPHGMGRFAECAAPWCVRNQKRIADARAALEEKP